MRDEWSEVRLGKVSYLAVLVPLQKAPASEGGRYNG